MRLTFEADVQPEDSMSCVALLRRTIARESLGQADQWRIQVWDQRRGWVEHRP